MTKIWCEKCFGSGGKEYHFDTQEVTHVCDNCHGKGYTEADVVEVEKVKQMVEDRWLYCEDRRELKYEIMDWLGSLNDDKRNNRKAKSMAERAGSRRKHRD